VGQWLFDEGKGDTVKDSSGKGHDGKINGAKWVKGKFGTALEFANGNSVVVSHKDDLSLETYTMEAWINVPKITGDWQGIIAKDGWPFRNYGIWVTNDTGQIHHSFNQGAPDNNVWHNSKLIVSDGKWHHIAATYDMKMERIYIDGALDGEKAANVKPGLTKVDVYIGRGSAGAHQLIGMIDEVRLSDAALSEADIKKSLQGLATTPVNAKGKLATSWGVIKANY
jgi:hypothetical protein